MAHPAQSNIRELILTVAQQQQPTGYGAQTLQQGSVLNEVSKRLGVCPGNLDVEEEILTQWHQLFRTGYLAWGLNLSNPGPPFFHFTGRGRGALERLTRDPANPAGYLRHLAAVANINPVAGSYLNEGLNCFVGGFFKAAAVMIGAASEAIILGLRDIAHQRLTAAQTAVPRGLNDWRIKIIVDALHDLLNARKNSFPRELREEFEAYWLAFAQQIRATRNDAGHPSSVDPVSEEGVHASYLIFPDLAKLSDNLANWMTESLT